MVNIYDLDIRRIICHEIEAKKTGMEHGTVLCDSELLELNVDVFNLIKERLAKAAENKSKAFDLRIGDYIQGSFFSFCSALKGQPNEKFITHSQEIAHLLAQTQTRNSIPGGNLIFIEALDKYDKSVYIVIKAELHAALRYELHDRKGKIKLLDDLFLSGEQKLYKFGIIYERSEVEKPDFTDLTYPNSHWGCFLYDSGFNADSKLAEYFYSDFLGFDVNANPKIQSRKFYLNTEGFIKANVESGEEKEDLLKVLKAEFLLDDDSSQSISPNDFAELYFHDEEVRDIYKNDVVEYLPAHIIKDPSLIKNRIQKKKLVFPNSITIAGPDNTFDINVRVVSSEDDKEELDIHSTDYTILKVLGIPQQEQ